MGLFCISLGLHYFCKKYSNDMKRIILFYCSVVLAACMLAETEYKGTFYNKEYHVRMKMNLEQMDIPVPGMEDLDSCYGYVQGKVNGAWIILKVKDKTNKKALVRAVSERGAEAQDMEIQMTEDGISVKLVGGTYMKGVEKNKYVKLPKPFVLTRE